MELVEEWPIAAVAQEFQRDPAPPVKALAEPEGVGFKAWPSSFAKIAPGDQKGETVIQLSGEPQEEPL